MFLRSKDFLGSGDPGSADQSGEGPPAKSFSGWWFVLAGVAIALIGLALLFSFAAAHVAINGHGRAQVTLLLLVPLGAALIVVGLVSVIRGKPLTDDSARHAAFQQRNRQLMRQQRDQRRADRGASDPEDASD